MSKPRSGADFARAHGKSMHDLAVELFPLNRSLTGEGVRATLRRLSQLMPMDLREVPTGTPAFDWMVPKEWRIRAARLTGPDGCVVADFAANNLHVVGYSTPVDEALNLAELQPHLHSLPEQPGAIPYVTSYYRETWGFCVSQRVRDALPEGDYHAFIDAELFEGSLTYAEAELAGEEDGLVLISSYVCHPSMANNELSGPVVAAHLHKWLAERPRRYTYRFVLFPETIGSLVYLSQPPTFVSSPACGGGPVEDRGGRRRDLTLPPPPASRTPPPQAGEEKSGVGRTDRANGNLEELQRRCVAGFHLSCIGDERAYSCVEARYGDTLADRAAAAALRGRDSLTRYSYRDRGSDERNYQAPGVDLPVVTLCRSKFGTYPEYHTSADDLTLVTPAGLAGGLDAAIACVEALEANHTYTACVLGEPQMGKRGLYPTTSAKGGASDARALLDVFAYCDGRNDVLALSERLDMPAREVAGHCAVLLQHGLIEAVDPARA